MSILIRGMEMPTSCLDCPFMVSRDGDDCILQSAEANESFENWEQMKAGCPLVPVPPHGRLIDGDVAEVIHFTEEDAEGRDFYDGILYAADFISKQTTIIEAEEGET